MRKRKTQEEFVQEIYSIVGNDYEVVGDYVNNNTKIKMKHNKCSTVYDVKPKGFKDGNRCPDCRNKLRGRRFKTTEEFTKELASIVGDEYTLVGDYHGATVKLKLLHKECGELWEVTPNAFLSMKVRCYGCARRKIGETNRRTHEEFTRILNETRGDEYQLIGEYNKSNEKVLVEHTVCGYSWKVRPYHLLEGQGCPRCQESNGEKMTREVLSKLGYSPEMQKEFPELKNKMPLSYDFFIPESQILIEYQGIQHYKPISFGGSGCPKKKLERQQYNDELKREYAKLKGYVLIEIPYTMRTHEQIEAYLINKLEYTA